MLPQCANNDVPSRGKGCIDLGPLDPDIDLDLVMIKGRKGQGEGASYKLLLNFLFPMFSGYSI